MRDKITLADDPFSAEYFARFADLTASIGALLADNPAPYIAYLKERRGRAAHVEPLDDEDAYCRNQAACVRRLAVSIRDDGYNSSEWRNCGRKLDYGQGQGPITVTIGADGTINSWDGLHRSAILRNLCRPIYAEVYQRNERWVELREFHKTLYTPYPHPDLARRKVLRPGGERFEAIGQWCKNNIDPIDALIIGACTGYGASIIGLYFQNVDCIESNAERFSLAHSLLSRTSGYIQVFHALAGTFNSDTEYKATIGLSVYHHVATSIEKWQAVCEKLKACPVHIVELPENSAKQWHDQFRAECTNGHCNEVIMSTLCKAGNYSGAEVIYTDHTYADRETVAIWRD